MRPRRTSFARNRKSFRKFLPLQCFIASLEQMSQPTITANISTPELVDQAKIAAVEERMSLREWAGRVLEAALAARAKAKAKSRARK
jgi:hypothetical protein